MSLAHSSYHTAACPSVINATHSDSCQLFLAYRSFQQDLVSLSSLELRPFWGRGMWFFLLPFFWSGIAFSIGSIACVSFQWLGRNSLFATCSQSSLCSKLHI
uniref:Uncharacterized protein n=1 Tax=Picea glauca TaxID=3330 RepID=A0A124GNT8_PICGL|nr:hypothetical protein ABT39_MTgene3108 [Picea glauca]QHR86476.1 hypothetical protein Q903MT_gene476 [Picea sitchensis]